MSTLTEDLEATLTKLDTGDAARLERLVRDAMALTRPSKETPREVGENGWPLGYFEETAGSFADEPFDFPSDLPLEPIPIW